MASDPSSSRPQKRSRKAINCEPCRASKLKCDRARPCSGCVLRGTVAACYADGRPDSLSDSWSADPKTVDSQSVDAQNEIARIRQSLASLESHLHRTANLLKNAPQQAPSPSERLISAPSSVGIITDISANANVHEMLLDHQGGRGGLYAGPTTAATNLAFASNEDERETITETAGEDGVFDGQHSYDLISLLPDVSTVDSIIQYYFESCTWLYRIFDQPSYTSAWNKFKQAPNANHLILSSTFVIIALTLQYLPAGHPILSFFHDTPANLSSHFYSLSCTAYSRYQVDTRMPSLELIELLLARTQFLGITKNHCEEIWRVRGEAVSMAVAMGLQRDPKQWGMSREVSERRRWAWWNLIFIERWFSFMFGRPPALVNHHFNTELPSDDYIDPLTAAPAGRSHLAYVQIFRMVYLTGPIVDDMVSVHPIPYERVLAHDMALKEWLQKLPAELDLDDYGLARALSSSSAPTRRMGVLSLCLRAAYFHLRFTLHRPFTAPHRRTGISAQSFDIAVSSAHSLIQLLTQSRPDFLPSSSLSVPGHLSWSPFHSFSAAMFFACQLLADPSHPAAPDFRADIQQVRVALERLRVLVPVADKAYKILQTLQPLYDDHTHLTEQSRAECLALVRRLAFPRESISMPSPAPSGGSPTESSRFHGGFPTIAIPQLGDTSNHRAPQASDSTFYQENSNKGVPMQIYSPEEALWSASFGLESSEWGRFLKDTMGKTST